MGEKLKKVGLAGRIVVFVVSLGLAFSAAWYLWASQQNPKVIELIVGSILITVVLGSCTDFYMKLREPNRRKYPTMGLLRSISLLVAMTAFLVYASNTPGSVRGEVLVTYVFQPTMLSIPYNLKVPDAHLLEPCRFFLAFRDRSTENRRIVEDMTQIHGREDIVANLKVFHDLTEYLLLWTMAHSYVTSDIELPQFVGKLSTGVLFPTRTSRARQERRTAFRGTSETTCSMI
jgi:hypothetical protein